MSSQEERKKFMVISLEEHELFISFSFIVYLLLLLTEYTILFVVLFEGKAKSEMCGSVR